MLDYGYRSRCCYAPIRLGFKKMKYTTLTKKVWICTRCKKKDVSIIEYTKGGLSGSSPIKQENRKFTADDEIAIQDDDCDVEES